MSTLTPTTSLLFEHYLEDQPAHIAVVRTVSVEGWKAIFGENNLEKEQSVMVESLFPAILKSALCDTGIELKSCPLEKKYHVEDSAVDMTASMTTLASNSTCLTCELDNSISHPNNLSSSELNIEESKKFKIKVYYDSGAYKTLLISSKTTSRDIIQIMHSKLDCQVELRQYALYEESTGKCMDLDEMLVKEKMDNCNFRFATIKSTGNNTNSTWGRWRAASAKLQPVPPSVPRQSSEASAGAMLRRREKRPTLIPPTPTAEPPTFLSIHYLGKESKKHLARHSLTRLEELLSDPRCKRFLDLNKLQKSKFSLFAKMALFTPKSSRSPSFMGTRMNLPLFGTALDSFMNEQMLRRVDLQVPEALDKCCEVLLERGLDTAGLFRISASAKQVQIYQEQINNGVTLDWSQPSVHDLAALLKLYLRQLPEPLLSFKLYDYFLGVMTYVRDEKRQYEALKLLVWQLPAPSLHLLDRILQVLHQVSLHATSTSTSTGNLMHAQNLALIMAPNLLYGKSESREMQVERFPDTVKVIRLLIENYETLFKVPEEMLMEEAMGKRNEEQIQPRLYRQKSTKI